MEDSQQGPTGVPTSLEESAGGSWLGNDLRFGESAQFVLWDSLDGSGLALWALLLVSCPKSQMTAPSSHGNPPMRTPSWEPPWEAPSNLINMGHSTKPIARRTWPPRSGGWSAPRTPGERPRRRGFAALAAFRAKRDTATSEGTGSLARSPGSPTKIDYRKKGTLVLTSLLEDLVGSPTSVTRSVVAKFLSQPETRRGNQDVLERCSTLALRGSPKREDTRGPADRGRFCLFVCATGDLSGLHRVRGREGRFAVSTGKTWDVARPKNILSCFCSRNPPCGNSR